MADEDKHAVDDLIERLHERVEERRAAGDYPDGLEEDLDQHFRRIAFHRTKADTTALDEAVAKLDASMDFSPRAIEIESSFPGGEMFHRALDKAMARQRQAMLEQMSEFAEVVRETVHVLADAVKNPQSHVHGDLVGRLDVILERLDRLEHNSSVSGK